MSGAPATPPAQPTVTDLEANRFMNALANDALAGVGSGAGGGAPMQVLIEDLLSNAAGTPQYDAAAREAAAEQLINSFGALGNRPLPQDMQNMIKSVFNDTSLTDAEDMARRIRESNFTADFVQLIADNQMNFGQVFDDQIMVMMQAMFPELAQLLEDLGLGEDPHETNADRRLEAELAEGWEAWQSGKVHNFNEIRGQDANGEDIPLRNWKNPSSEHDINEFFGHGDTEHSQGLWGDDVDYQFTDADTGPTPNTFAGMILAKWEADGVVEFSGTQAEQDAARAAFVQRSHTLAVGGELDGTFADTLADRDVIEFASDADRQAFIDHMMAWRDEPGGQYRDAQEIMQEVIDYVNEPGGAEWIDPNFSDETASQFSTTQSAVYRVAQQYTETRDGEAYAQQMIRFAEEHPHIQITPPAAPAQGGPSAAAGDPSRTPPPTPPADPNAITAVRFDASETGAYLDYGDAITGDFDATTMSFTANGGTEVFKFSDDFQVFGVGMETSPAGGHTLTMDALDMNGRSPQEVLEALGDDFKVSVVAHQDDGMDVDDSELLGFYIESADGSMSFYVGPGAVEEGSLTTEGKTELIKGIEETPGVDRTASDYDVNADPNNSASTATNSGATVDNQQDNLNVFQP
ncbi:MAG: hypothetical protein JKY71_10615 [Alphaproteobacteria bacterium]|nr:hypothetical protein [Alphaproteobacteria bacterium]